MVYSFQKQPDHYKGNQCWVIQLGYSKQNFWQTCNMGEVRPHPEWPNIYGFFPYSDSLIFYPESLISIAHGIRLLYDGRQDHFFVEDDLVIPYNKNATE